MKQKMTSKLKELFPNLGLTDAVLDQVSGVAIVGLAADADDAAITERAKAYEAMLKAFQSDTDRRVNDAVKKAGNKGGDPTTPTTPTTPPTNPTEPNGMPDWFKAYSEKQDAERKTLLDKIAALEGKNAEKTFDELVAKVAGELGLTGAYLTLAKRGLSADMDEAKIKEEMGAVKKLIAESGATLAESLPVDKAAQEEKARQEAAEWVKEHAVK